MNLGYYLLAFEDAARHLFTQLDVSEAYRKRTNHALFANDDHQDARFSSSMRALK